MNMLSPTTLNSTIDKADMLSFNVMVMVSRFGKLQLSAQINLDTIT